MTDEEIEAGAEALARMHFLDGSKKPLGFFSPSQQGDFRRKARAVLEAAKALQQPAGKPETVRVRICVGIRTNEKWTACGDWLATEHQLRGKVSTVMGDCSMHWIEADVPIPRETVIPGTVTEDGE